MRRSLRFFRFFPWLLTRRWRSLLLHPALLLSGAALVLFSLAFLLAVQWDDAPPPGAAGSGLQGDVQLTPDATIGEEDGAPNVGPSLAPTRLLTALRPTPTLIAAPVPAPTLASQEPPAPPPTATPGAPRVPITTRLTPQPPPPPSCPTASMSGFALALFDATNNERTQRGLPTLAANGCVVYVAQLRSDDMASRGYFSHTSPEGETAFSLMDRFGVPYSWAGENLARNNYPDDESVAVVIRDLMASEGHRANILNVNFTQMGIGATVDGAGMKYFTMVFSGPP